MGRIGAGAAAWWELGAESLVESLAEPRPWQQADGGAGARGAVRTREG